MQAVKQFDSAGRLRVINVAYFARIFRSGWEAEFHNKLGQFYASGASEILILWNAHQLLLPPLEKEDPFVYDLCEILKLANFSSPNNQKNGNFKILLFY